MKKFNAVYLVSFKSSFKLIFLEYAYTDKLATEFSSELGSQSLPRDGLSHSENLRRAKTPKHIE